MNFTLAVDEKLVDRARQAAHAMGKSLYQVVREQLEQLAGTEQIEAKLTAHRQLTAQMPGRLNSRTFDRDEVQRGA
jgi:antitoxin component of RelBE/YafQ-DinJ toxin-antitoxin module